MIKQFALEPRLLDNWKDFRYFVEMFGASRGRVISRYPSKWKQMVYHAARQCPDAERKRIEVALQSLDDRRLWPRIHEWFADHDWLPNAVAEHEKRPFAGIVARENSDGHPTVLVGDEVGEHDPRWKSYSQRTIRRDSAEIANCVAPLLHAAKQVCLVEPHLRPQDRRFRDPLRELFKCLSSERLPIRQIRLELHAGDRVEELEFRRQCEQHLPRLIPEGVELRIVRWSQSELHNRYVLTDLAGAMFGTGLDQAGPAGTQEDTVVLLEDEQHQTEWTRYQGRQPLCVIVGVAPIQI